MLRQQEGSRERTAEAIQVLHHPVAIPYNPLFSVVTFAFFVPDPCRASLQLHPVRSLAGGGSGVGPRLKKLIVDRCFESERVVVGFGRPQDSGRHPQHHTCESCAQSPLQSPYASYGFDTGSVSSLDPIQRGEKL